jgi:hypothetical protein
MDVNVKRVKKHYVTLRAKNKNKKIQKKKFVKHIHFIDTKSVEKNYNVETLNIRGLLRRNVAPRQISKVIPSMVQAHQPVGLATPSKVKRVQICGLFNSGTNLMANVISEIFDVVVGDEGHLDFWKHTVVGKQFAKQHVKKNTLYIVVSKNPYFQFHSFKKQLYSIKTNATNDINAFVKQCLSIKAPRSVVTDISNLEFKHFPHYWNSFYRHALNFIPNIVVVKYEDLLFNPHCVIDNLEKYMQLKNVNVNEVLSLVLNTPSKQSGKPRFGDSAKLYYDPENVKGLFDHETFQWINTRLDSDIMNALNYSFTS